MAGASLPPNAQRSAANPRRGGDIDVGALLHQTMLLGGLDQPAIDELSRRSRLRRYRRGETIFLQEDPGDSLFVVAHGLVKIFVTSPRGDDLVLSTLGPCQTFGELALLDGGGRSASAEAANDCMVVIVERAKFLEVLNQRPELIDRLMLTLGQMVRRLTEQAGDLAFLDMQGRVAKLLLQLATGDSGSPAEEVDVPLSQTDLARMVGASRQTVNQILRAFQLAGFITVTGRTLRILRRDALIRRAAD